MRPTWNNVTQTPRELIRQSQNWRDEIFSIKMALLMHIQGDIRSHLLKENLFEDAAKKVEEYHRNVYVDNNFGGVNGMKGKYNKGKGRDKKGKNDCRDYSHTSKGKGYTNVYQNYQNGESKGKKAKVPTLSVSTVPN
eukprot:6464423-Amphidinium_carterae.1